MPAASDLNLLYGVLALQLDFVRRDQLIAGMQVWINRKQTALGELLVEQGALAAENHQLLSALVKKHLEQHANDPQQSLAAISSVVSARQELEYLADPDLQASIGHLASAEQILATQSIALGNATSEGLRFRILRPHARGGLREVSVAHDSELNREVALKEIQSRFADHPENRSRFLLEAQITGGLEHPGIVPVYGLGTYADGRPFYAMRFIRGDSLNDGIRKFFAKYSPAKADESADQDETKQVRKLPPAAYESLDFRPLLGRFVDVCNALAYAHARGVLHRDLKPGNIMLGNFKRLLNEDQVRGSQRKTAPAVITYYENNREHMRYDEYLAAGYPIGSGVAEGACRHLVKDRLEQTGMRWTVNGAQAMLHTRAIYLNGDWNEFLEYRIQTAQTELYGQTAA